MAKAKRTIGYQIRRPSETTRRATYALLRFKYGEKGERKDFETVDTPEVGAINQALASGLYDREKCDELMKEILDRYNAEARKGLGRVVHCQDNLRLLDEFMDTDYSHRTIEDESVKTFKWSCERAIEAVGVLSLYTASITDIQAAVNKQFKNEPAKQREAVDRLNTLLRYIGRVKAKHDKLKRARKPQRKVKHLSLEQLGQVLPLLESEQLRAMARASFGTGTRVGELFALTPDCVVGSQLLVNKQVKRDLSEKDPKLGKTRLAYVTKLGREALAEFFEIPANTRDELRTVQHAKLFRAACKKAFPKNPEKWCCWHDLRHSYAIHLIRNGVSLTLVAQSLGNSVQVCQEYYAGFSLTNETVTAISRIMGE